MKRHFAERYTILPGGIKGLCFVALLLTALAPLAAQKTTSTSTNVTTIVHDVEADGSGDKAEEHTHQRSNERRRCEEN